MGQRNGNGQISGGTISGNGRLSIRPSSSNVNIALGGTEQSIGQTLSITDGEVNALQNGFTEIVIGDTKLTEQITIQDSVGFSTDVSLRSQNDITALTTSAGQLANLSSTGSLELVSETGGLSLGGLSTNSGTVTLRSPDDITLSFIDARGTTAAATSGQISVDTEGNFVSTGLAVGTTDSIVTNSTDSAAVSLRFGRADRLAEPFTIGSLTANGTAQTISTGLLSSITINQDLSPIREIGNLELINRGIMPTPTSLPNISLADAIGITAQTTTAATEISLPLFGFNQTENNTVRDILSQIETGVSDNFSNYLDIQESARADTVTLFDMQDTLRAVTRKTEVEPALVYVYFVPDAAAEDAVVTGSDRPARPGDQLEIMLVTADHELVRRRQWGITREQVETASHQLRTQVTSEFSGPRQYLPPAQQLYNWLVRPIHRELEQRQIDSLGFVMDTGLRTVPLAALHDGDRYLIESYSLGLLPTFSLTDFNRTVLDDRTDFETASVLAMGASEFTDQRSLPAVEAEVNLITRESWEGDTFLNEHFVLNNLQNQLTKNEHQILHLATHAAFRSGNLDDSYIQLWDEQLSLAKMNDLQLSESDISLIILSACSTAMGDDASEYGFAGFAVNAGAQSALASLWPVNDEGTLGFMSQFYNQLRGVEARTKALQQAQIRLLKESGRWDFSHPFYWSAFTMIGNPW